jgi:predicted ATP-grasp superfamily ATP-dependent carboligase
MIVPLGDIVTDLVARHRDQFARHTRLLVVPYDTFRVGRDKVETMKAAERCAVPIPKTWYPEEQDLDQIAHQAAWPVLVKPAIANGARGIRRVRSPDELPGAYAAVAREFGRTFVQEFIPHAGMQYKVDLILSREGELLAGVVYNKIRFYPPAGGSSVLNCSVHHPQILEYATRIARAIGWFGLCDFDFIHDVRDNTPKLMEINPRFPESFRMCQVAGVDFPEILHRMAQGRRVQPRLEYKTDRYLRFLAADVLWFLTARGQRFSTQPGFFSFFDPRITDQIWSLRDPGPMIGYLLENLVLAMDPRERAFRYRLQEAKP